MFNLVLLTGIFRSSHDNALRWMPQDLTVTDDKSRLVQVMAWCRQTTSHYLSLCWLSSLSLGHNKLSNSACEELIQCKTALSTLLKHWRVHSLVEAIIWTNVDQSSMILHNVYGITIYSELQNDFQIEGLSLNVMDMSSFSECWHSVVLSQRKGGSKWR